MIRDFCGVSKKRLVEEIRALREQSEAGNAAKGVNLDVIDAIDAVREVGNIGAHMEADISVIVDVDEGEAEALIRLLELLFDEWYIAREQRANKIAATIGIAKAKQRPPPQSDEELQSE